MPAAGIELHAEARAGLTALIVPSGFPGCEGLKRALYAFINGAQCRR